MGISDGNRIRVAKDKIELGTKDASEKVPVDSKVQQEIKAVRDTLETHIQNYNLHMHITTATVATGPPGTIAPTTSQSTPPKPVGSTESGLVTIEK